MIQATSTQHTNKVRVWKGCYLERKDSNSGWVKNLGYADFNHLQTIICFGSFPRELKTRENSSPRMAGSKTHQEADPWWSSPSAFGFRCWCCDASRRNEMPLWSWDSALVLYVLSSWCGAFQKNWRQGKKICSARMAGSKPIRKQTHKHDHQHHQRGHVDSGFDVVMQNQEVKCPCNDDGTLQLPVQYVLSSLCGAFQENWRREKIAVQEYQEANPSENRQESSASSSHRAFGFRCCDAASRRNEMKISSVMMDEM